MTETITMNDKSSISEPLVSVVMPAYNCDRFIEAAITSVINQTYGNWELIIIDDGSSDSTCSVAESFSKEDKRISIVKNPNNMGVAKTRNRGLDLAKGDYVALLDSDDLWCSDKLEKQIALAKKANADIVYCSYAIIDECGNKRCDDFVVPETTDYNEMLVRTTVNCSTAVLSRKIVDNYRFCTDYYHEDFLLWLDILKDNKTAVGVVDVLAKYRVMQGSRSFNKFKSAMHRWKIYRDYLNIPFLRSVSLLAKYALLATKKYKIVRIENR